MKSFNLRMALFDTLEDCLSVDWREMLSLSLAGYVDRQKPDYVHVHKSRIMVPRIVTMKDWELLWDATINGYITRAWDRAEAYMIKERDSGQIPIPEGWERVTEGWATHDTRIYEKGEWIDTPGMGDPVENYACVIRRKTGDADYQYWEPCDKLPDECPEGCQVYVDRYCGWEPEWQPDMSQWGPFRRRWPKKGG